MSLREKALATLNLEFPGLTDLGQGFQAARTRVHDLLLEMRRLEANQQRIQYELDQTRYAYHEASRAEQLFENALIESENDEILPQGMMSPLKSLR